MQLREASEKGVLCFDIGDGDCSEAEYLCEAQRLARFPSLAIANMGLPIQNVRKLMPNVLVTCISELRGFAKPFLQGILAYRSQNLSELETLKSLNIPLIVHRSIGPNQSVTQARAACDKLQADLAPYGQFAG